MLRKRLTPLVLIAITALLASGCGGDDSTGPGTTKSTGGSSTGVSGTWNSVNVNSNGVPSSRYYFEPVPTTNYTSGEGDIAITGDAYYRWNGLLEHVGPLSGTVAEDGSASITVILDDNGWAGKEVMTGTFVGGVLKGDYVVTNPDGSVWDDGSYQLNREPAPAELPAGTGVLGDGGLWRGSLLRSSPGGCGATGRLMTITFQEGAPASDNGTEYVPLTGTVSARVFPGGDVPEQLSAFLGPITATLTGRRIFSPDHSVEFDLSGGISGHYVGGFNITQSSTVLGGTFTNGPVCTDDFGETNSGLFVLVGFKIVLETAQ